MSRGLQYLNLAGVLILTALCIAQWKINRELNLGTNHFEKVRIEQSQQIAEQQKSLRGCNADLELFRDQLQNLATALKDSEVKLRAAQSEAAQLTAHRDQLKESVTKWSEAVAARDDQIGKAREQIETLAKDRNDAVSKFNDLAEKYNSVAEDLNTRTKDFNALVERYNALTQEKAAK